jgi:ParB family chromosome partitioning protein
MAKREDWTKRTDKSVMANPEALYQGPNPRTVFDPEKLATLKEQIRQDGVTQQILVRRGDNGEGGKLEVFDGERRLRCVRELIAEGVDIPWVPVLIRRGSNAEMMLVAANTTMGKDKLDPVDEANMVRMLLGCGLKQADIAKRLGVGASWVSRREKLIEATPRVQDALRAGEVTIGLAEELSQKDDAKQDAAIDKIKAKSAKGAKRAGSVAPKRPGKKAISKLREEFASSMDGTEFAGEIILCLFDWLAGNVDEDKVREALALDEE